MELVRGLHKLRPPRGGSAVTIGNFDGVHRGHQALIERVCTLARQKQATPTAVIFEPHSREYFARGEVPGRVMELRGKLRALSRYGIERVLCLPFGSRLAAMSARDFVRQVVVEGLGARALVVGDDFRFGRDQRGDFDMLRRAGEAHDLPVEALDSVKVDGERVSSTRLRTVLARPDLELAARLLGRPYAMLGRVRHGLRLGHELDMPTANVTLRRMPALRQGVYAVRARCGDHESVAGVASLGVRPTLNLDACILETHLFESPGDLYGKELETTFVHFLRPQQRFDNLDALAKQMHADAEQARTLLAVAS